MEFIIDQNALQKELGFLRAIVERKVTVPALANILIESADEQSIRITGTDLDVRLLCQTPARISAPGSLCVPAQRLFEIVRLLPAGAPVLFSRGQSEWVTLTCLDARFRLSGLTREGFPEMPEVKNGQVSVPADVLKTMIDRTIFAITQEESRYTLSGAKFCLSKAGGARMVTTNGHRLAFIEARGAGKRASKAGLDTLIPRKAVAGLAMLAAAHTGEVGIRADENHLSFELGTRLLTCRQLGGEFPAYEQVLPKEANHVVLCHGDELRGVIERVAVMAEGELQSVVLHFAPGQLEISAESAEEGEAHELLDVDYRGEEMEVRFKAGYLLDFLKALGSGSVEIRFTTASGAAELRLADETEYDYRCVIMPLRP